MVALPLIVSLMKRNDLMINFETMTHLDNISTVCKAILLDYVGMNGRHNTLFTRQVYSNDISINEVYWA